MGKGAYKHTQWYLRICRIYTQQRGLNAQFHSWDRLWLSAKLEGNLLSAEKSSLQSQSVQLMCSPHPHSLYLSSDSPSSASSFEMRYRLFKNSSMVISSPHTHFPLFQCPGLNILRTYRKPSQAGHLGTGSSRWKLQLLCGRRNTALQCVVKTSVPTRHCSALIRGGKGGRSGG